MKEYTVVIGGLEHTVLLDDDEAKARGLEPVDRSAAKAKPVAANKAATARNKSA